MKNWKIFLIVMTLLVIATVLCKSVFFITIKPCEYGDAVPNPIFGSHYVLVEGQKLYFGQAFKWQEEYLWKGTARLIWLSPKGATFLVTRPAFDVIEEEDGEAIICRAFVSNQHGTKRDNVFITKNPEILRALLITPEDIDDPWIKETYRVRTEVDVNVFFTDASDLIEAIVSAKKESDFDLDQSSYFPVYRVDQMVYLYQNEEEAIEAFFETPWTGNIDTAGIRTNYEPLVINHKAYCGILGPLYCVFRAQQGKYMTELLVVVKEPVTSEEDWLKLIPIVQQKLISAAAE